MEDGKNSQSIIVTRGEDLKNEGKLAYLMCVCYRTRFIFNRNYCGSLCLLKIVLIFMENNNIIILYTYVCTYSMYVYTLQADFQILKFDDYISLPL